MSSINIIQNGIKSCCEASEGANLLEVLRNAGYEVSAPCGGNGKCGKCLVNVDGEECLACRTCVQNGMTVELKTEQGGEIRADETENNDFTPRQGIGAAVDLGTTTVAVKRFDLSTGREIETKTAWNAQKAYGADVISRAQYTMEHDDGLERLSGIIRSQIGELCSDADEVFVAGNTVMEHIAAGISPKSIALAPFKPETLFEEGGKDEKFRFSPCVAGYVGGDITSGILACGLDRKPGKNLFLDIGTNGEMALGGENGFVSCAVACGPAFEGAGISCGMQSIKGAVNRVRIENGRPVYDVIGGGEIEGLCGSGLIDLLAVLLELEIVDETGRLLPPDEAPDGFEDILKEDENENGEFHLTETVYLSAADVRQLQLAKAAVAAGIRVLTDSEGISLREVDALYLAGGFGSWLNVKNAVCIGMLPKELADRIVTVGNSSLKGAVQVLLKPEKFAELLDIQRNCRYIELSGNREFSDEFMEQMLFE